MKQTGRQTDTDRDADRYLRTDRQTDTKMERERYTQKNR